MLKPPSRRPPPSPPPSSRAGLFPNTRSDLGRCEADVHEEHVEWAALSEQYAQLPERERER